MRRFLPEKILAGFIALCLVLGVVGQLVRPRRGGKIDWRADVAPALDEAQRDGKPAILYFTADW